MFVEVLTLTYHSPITIDSCTYGLLLVRFSTHLIGRHYLSISVATSHDLWCGPPLTDDQFSEAWNSPIARGRSRAPIAFLAGRFQMASGTGSGRRLRSMNSRKSLTIGHGRAKTRRLSTFPAAFSVTRMATWIRLPPMLPSNVTMYRPL